MLMKFALGVGVAAFMTSAAFAQSYQPEVGSGNIVQNPSASNSAPAFARSQRGAYAYARPAPYRHRYERMEQ